MTDSATFKLVNHWFNQLVEEPEEQQKATIKQLLKDMELSPQQAELLAKMLAADKDQSMPDKVADLQHDWSQNETETQISEQPIIGSYRLLELIGSGGMGHVYLADRVDGSYEQKVAIKVAQFHMSPVLVKRFENERQILAKLSHPNIAQLLDGGTAANDQPYLVMEYIKGQSIDEYCIAENLGLKGRLDLVLQTCEAVSFAHQNLILHRDLKPANILVNETGQVKLLDFGIAKLLVDDVDQQQQTMTQIMTRNYASPEQIKGEQVSTQSDLFSLAVITYELISGYHPYTRNSEIERDQNVVSGKIKRITARTTNPQDDPNAIFPELTTIGNDRLKGDLENILLKALSANAADRYSSVDAFAQDLNNYLYKRPITARKPSKWYIFNKLIQRNKITVTITLIATVLLLLSTVVALFQASLAREQQIKSEIEAKKAASTADFLTQIFIKANPNSSTSVVTAQDILLDAYQRLQVDEQLDSATRFHLISIIYRSMTAMNLYKEVLATAPKDYSLCTEQLSAEVISCQNILTIQYKIHVNQKHSEQAKPILQQAEKIELNKQQPDEDMLLEIYDGLLVVNINLGQAENSLEYGHKALKIRMSNPETRLDELITGMNNLAIALIQLKEFDKAKAMIKDIEPRLNEIDETAVKLRKTQSYYALWSFYYGSIKNSVKAAEYRVKGMNTVVDEFEVKSTNIVRQFFRAANQLVRADEFDRAKELFGQAENLMIDNADNYKYQFYRINLEQALMATINNEVNQYEQYKTNFSEIGYEFKQESFLEDLRVWMDTIWLIRDGTGDTAAQLQLLQTQLIKNNDLSELNEMYLNLAMATNLSHENNHQEAAEYIEKALVYWQKWPHHFLHFQRFAESLAEKINHF